MTLSFTGERFLTECQGEMVYEHWHRYLLAREHAKGKRVLDVASGEGYGSHLLSSVAESVVGVDISSDAVAHASAKYSRSNLKYVTASCTQIPLPDASFDFIVSFETIEHIDAPSQQLFLNEVKRLLAPDGVFLISSPNRPEYSDKTGYKNEYHVRELDKAELANELSARWPHSMWAGQRAAFHSIVWPIDALAESNRALSVDADIGFPEAMYFLVYCSNDAAAINAIKPSLTLVADRENSVYAEWSRTYRENAALHDQLKRLQSELERVSSDTAITTATIATTAARTTTTTPSPTPPISKESWLVRAARKIAG